MSISCLNGVFVEQTELCFPSANRAFRYGDGCFETLRIMNGVPVFWKYHFERLTSTLDLLSIDLMESESALKHLIQTLLSKNGISWGGALRISVFRSGQGKYFPLTNKAEVLLECFPLEQAHYGSPQFKKAILYEGLKLPIHELGNHKIISKTIHINAAIRAQKTGCNEALLLNTNNEVAEAVSSNVYVAIKGDVFTPKLDSGCLNGTIRNVLLTNNESMGLRIIEKEITLSDAGLADEIWTTNSITGIAVLESWCDRKLGCDMARKAQRNLTNLALSSIQDFQENLQ